VFLLMKPGVMSMFIVFLRFSTNKDQAKSLMSAHVEWIKNGIAEGVFLLVGSIKPSAGGVVLVLGLSRAEVEQRVSLDPFVEHDVVVPDIIEISPSQVDDRLRFVLEAS